MLGKFFPISVEKVKKNVFQEISPEFSAENHFPQKKCTKNRPKE
jgi:hypothetical protein